MLLIAGWVIATEPATACTSFAGNVFAVGYAASSGLSVRAAKVISSVGVGSAGNCRPGSRCSTVVTK